MSPWHRPASARERRTPRRITTTYRETAVSRVTAWGAVPTHPGCFRLQYYPHTLGVFLRHCFCFCFCQAHRCGAFNRTTYIHYSVHIHSYFILSIKNKNKIKSIRILTELSTITDRHVYDIHLRIQYNHSLYHCVGVGVCACLSGSVMVNEMQPVGFVINNQQPER